MTNKPHYIQLIPDFGLSDEQLRDRYDPDGDDDKSHPAAGFAWWDWFQAVAQRTTRDGYWVWLRMKLVEAQDDLDLDRDNPYNQPWSGA